MTLGRGRAELLVLLEEERHLAAERGVARSALVLDGLLVHADVDAALEAARAALVAVRLVHEAGALGLGLADVLAIAADGALKETRRQTLQSRNFFVEAKLQIVSTSS